MKLRKNIKLRDGREVNVRSLTIDDKAKLVAMFSSMSEEALRWSMAPYTEEVIERWIKSLENLIPLVVEHDDLTIGYASIHKLSHPRRRGIGDLAIYLHQDFQSVGLGTALTEMLLEMAKEEGLHKIVLYVVEENKIAERLYRKFGFQTEGVMKDSFLGEDDKYHDILVMGKILDRDL